jgi:hypothetical protein
MKIEPTQKDGMPYEVATALLTEPRAKLTNRMRKNCWAARAKEFSHPGPMARTCTTDMINRGLDKHGRARLVKQHLEDLPVKVIAPEQKLARKLVRLPLARLERFMVRAARGRMNAQRKFVALQDEADKLGNDKQRARHTIELMQGVWANVAQRFEMLMDSAETELKYRDSLGLPVQVIDPVILRKGNRCHAN